MTAPAATGFLAEMERAARARARRLVARTDRAELERRARRPGPAPALALSRAGFDLVAEVKFRSPAAGRLAASRGARDAAERARGHAAAGACAVSVLTEPTRFAGALAHLRAAARAAPVPILRKDFLVDPLQVLEARAAGAGGVLLVVRMLQGDLLEAMLDAAGALALFALLEAFDARDLERAARCVERRTGQALLVGVNARDLATLATDRERHLALASLLPAGVPCVAESGIESAHDARAVAAAGYRLALVGGALMRAQAPAAHVRELLEAGRAAAEPGRRA